MCVGQEEQAWYRCGKALLLLSTTSNFALVYLMIVKMTFCHLTLQLLNFLNVVMTEINLLMKENQQI